MVTEEEPARAIEQLLARLGHKLVLTRQIHVQDSYTRLGFFLYDVLTQLAELARRRNDIGFTEQCLAQPLQLCAANPLDSLNANLRTLHGGRD